MSDQDPAGGATAGELAELYQRPLREFVEARNLLAARLAAHGRQQAARQVRGIGRPSPAVWVINCLAREEATGIAELLDVGSRLRRCQSRVMAGDRQAPASLRSLGEEQRLILDRLRERAAGLLRDAGHAASEATLRRVEASLRSAAVADRDVRQALLEGRLGAELAPTGFVELPVLVVVPDPDAVPDERASQDRAAAGDEGQGPGRAEADAAAKEGRMARARQRLRMAELELAEQEAAARRADAGSRRAADRLRRVRTELSVAEADAARADQEARRSGSRLAAARRALQEAEAWLAELGPHSS